MRNLKLPFTLLMSGHTGSGKTFLFKKLFNEMRDKFDFVIFFSPTVKISGDFSMYKEQPDPKKGQVIQKFSESEDFITITAEIIDSQKILLESDGIKRSEIPSIMLVYDDCANLKITSFRNILDKFSMSSRHYNTSIVLLTQRLSAIGRSIRLNAKYVILFSCSNFSELQQFSEQYLLRKHKKEFEGMLQEIFSVPYNFILIENFNPNVGERMYLNGKDLIEFSN